MRNSLLDRAAKVCGNDTKLGIAIGASCALISRMRSGERSITPKWIVLLANITGEDATPYLLDAVAEKLTCAKCPGFATCRKRHQD